MKPVRIRRLRPFESHSRWIVLAILATFVIVAAVSVTLTLSATGKAHDRGTIVEVAARQRTLVERYFNEVLLQHSGAQADPATTATALSESARALLNGGAAPAVNGDDDETSVPPASGEAERAQIEQESRLIADVTATGEALLAGRPASTVALRGGEQITATDPVQRLRIGVALVSATALNVARTVAMNADNSVNSLVDTELWLAIGGLVASLCLAGALVATSRRQTAHFRTLAQSSTDLLALVDEKGCRYASPSLVAKTGISEEELLGAGLAEFVHEDDRPLLQDIARTAQPAAVSFRLRDGAGEWRHLDARVSDLRDDRHLRGVVINARDTTERFRLEQELTQKADRDGYVSRLAEALEMADEEPAVCDVVERAMADVSEATPMELLLSDSSRANLRRVADSPTAGAPGCGVKSPFSCVAVRRGSAVVFESSEELNGCPHLRGREGGACSAVCVPVGFMGRSLGVLHTTGPDRAPLGEESIDRLRALAAQSGSRIGTVRAFEKTQLQASTDGLTGLVNRRTAETKLREMVKAGSLFSVVLADLDHFKQLNDTHGHESGDRALRLFATVAEEALRDHDIISRWGGEEFIIVLPELDRFQAVSVIDRLRLRLSRAHPGETARFTASFGVADSNQSDAVEKLVQIADVGLYAAKKAGRDRAMIGESDGPIPVPRAPSTSEDSERSGQRPPIQEASYEEDPAPSGSEIR